MTLQTSLNEIDEIPNVEKAPFVPHRGKRKRDPAVHEGDETRHVPRVTPTKNQCGPENAPIRVASLQDLHDVPFGLQLAHPILTRRSHTGCIVNSPLRGHPDGTYGADEHESPDRWTLSDSLGQAAGTELIHSLK